MEYFNANMPQEVAKDLVNMINSLQGLKKRGKVLYKNYNNSTTEFNYCLLEDIVEAVKADPNFCVLTPVEWSEDSALVFCTLIHKSGYFMRSSPYKVQYPAEVQNKAGQGTPKKPQTMAALITYARRYVLTTFLNIAADEDVDGAGPAAQPMPPKNKEEEEQAQADKAAAAAVQNVTKKKAPEKTAEKPAEEAQQAETTEPKEEEDKEQAPPKEESPKKETLEEKIARARELIITGVNDHIFKDQPLKQFSGFMLEQIAKDKRMSDKIRAAARFLATYDPELKKKKKK